MKIFSVKKLLGLAAIGGAIAYVRKQGGFKQALEDLQSRKDQLLKKVEAKKSEMSSQQGSSYSGSGIDDVTGYTGGSSYGRGGGFERH